MMRYSGCALWLIMLMVVNCGVHKERQIPEKRVKCVSLVPSVTEIIFAIGAEDMLVGTTNQCDFPPAAKEKTKVGDFQSPDIERIVSLKPDVVFATQPIHQRLIERLAEFKVQVYVSNPADVEGVFAEIESVGVILRRTKEAERLVAALRRRLDSLPTFSYKPKVYVEISMAPLMSVGQGVFINDIISRAGGQNIFQHLNIPYPVVDPEAVVQENPDVILLLHPLANKDELKKRVGWSNINAVLSGRIYTGLDEDLFFRPGPRVVDGVILLARILHPERFR
ncbi:MAG: cobalamin-binding protein [candidate division WOR-3 bacterium]|jgi:iron complex transport system substrate-binding protein|nr:cobalamin-binding protein [candidate division WOR-3 bacterium]MCR4423513.1 cobalamin-binding protein [candidate division WOR-3 bacterium]MDH7518852.1 cobalamin-binding protein [bacterium]